MEHKQRSDYLIDWINSHPLINVAMLCKLAGNADHGNMSNALSGTGRNISQKHIDAMERILKDYGFKAPQPDG
jgi:hypothetical protein